MLWIKLRDAPRLSWHIVEGDHTRCGPCPGGHTRCGRSIVVPSHTATDLPMGERSCESCARLLIHDQEKAG